MKYGRSNPVPQNIKDDAIARVRMGEDMHDIAADIGVARWTVAGWCRVKPEAKVPTIANILSMPLVRLDENQIRQEN